ncbi:MAG: MAPEG family protein [Gammaproteobacteria bacterium]|nr:MAPEG family protein [Gammaproteobacteria bacterium]
MTSPTAFALTAFVAWTLLLLVLMEIIRSKLVMTGEVAANEFAPDNANLSPFMQRLARAHANCVEGLPVFGGLMLIALAVDLARITDGLAYYLLAARILQSLIHLLSTSAAAVTLRFSAFAVQIGIGVYWSAVLLQHLLT